MSWLLVKIGKRRPRGAILHGEAVKEIDGIKEIDFFEGERRARVRVLPVIAKSLMCNKLRCDQGNRVSVRQYKDVEHVEHVEHAKVSKMSNMSIQNASGSVDRPHSSECGYHLITSANRRRKFRHAKSPFDCGDPVAVRLFASFSP